jgi:hypothetical protein
VSTSTGKLSRCCPDCQVATVDDDCWMCGADINRHEYKATYRIANPTGPLPEAVGTSLDL